MKKNIFPFTAHKRGFTLTEVLLAVMIVGLISVALAALTRAAARESGVGRSKIILRNNLSSFVRTLRNDLAHATTVNTRSITTPCATGNGSALFDVIQNIDKNNQPVISGVSGGWPMPVMTTPVYITYCFVCGSDTQNISPSGATRGGKIYRKISTTSLPRCSSYQKNELVLDNVKYLSEGTGYPVPFFRIDPISRLGSLLRVKLIVELNSVPVVNEVIDETFAVPIGY